MQLHEAEFVYAFAIRAGENGSANDAYELCNLSKRLKRLNRNKALTKRQERARDRAVKQAESIASRLHARISTHVTPWSVGMQLRFSNGETLYVC